MSRRRSGLPELFKVSHEAEYGLIFAGLHHDLRNRFGRTILRQSRPGETSYRLRV